MPNQFYYQSQGAVIGPVSAVALREAAFRRQVLPSTLVSTSSTGRWVPAKRVRGLFDETGIPIPHRPKTEELSPGKHAGTRVRLSEQDERMDALLDQWEEAQQQGRPLAPDELCKDAPELLEVLKHKIACLGHLDDLMATAKSSDYISSESFSVPEALGRYKLVEFIGQGGFGQVWKALDPELDREVAIKLLRPERQQSVLQTQNFLNEARKVAKLQHKNIVSVYDVGHAGSLWYIVTELIDGTDLAKRAKDSRLSVVESAELVAKIADALQHAHESGIIHRDVKPHNILLDKRQEPFITDFGIAVTEVELRAGVDTAGTPAYMSPEQASPTEQLVDSRTDIYSLGVVLYELLVGSVPHQAKTLAVLRSKLRTDRFPEPASMNPEVSRYLNDVCIRALEQSPGDRWRSARDFSLHLHEVLLEDRKEKAEPIERYVSQATATRLRRRKLFKRVIIGTGVATVVLLLFCAGIPQYVSDLAVEFSSVAANATTEERHPRLFSSWRLAAFAVFVVITLVRFWALLSNVTSGFFHIVGELLYINPKPFQFRKRLDKLVGRLKDSRWFNTFRW